MSFDMASLRSIGTGRDTNDTKPKTNLLHDGVADTLGDRSAQSCQRPSVANFNGYVGEPLSTKGMLKRLEHSLRKIAAAVGEPIEEKELWELRNACDEYR